MRIIKVDAIESSNSFLRDWNREKHITNPVCIVAKEQLAGKGQMGTIWQSNPNENLTCSVFMPISEIAVVDQFYVSIVASLAVYDTLQIFNLPNLSIKWPNDILSDRYKVCGILIENVVNSGRLRAAIIGIGININQQQFYNLPLARSLKQLLGRDYNIDEVLSVLIEKLIARFSILSETNFAALKEEYESFLFRKNTPSAFLDAEQEFFVGIIQNITPSGKLQVLLEDDMIQDFALKEIKLLY